MKFDTPSTSASSYLKVPVAWGNHLPHPTRCLLTIYGEISYYSFDNSLLTGVTLVLESLWTDETKLSPDTNLLVNDLIENNARIKISRNPSMEERDILKKLPHHSKSMRFQLLKRRHGCELFFQQTDSWKTRD